MPLAPIGDRVLFYERRGAGQPLLLIQGMAGHHLVWGEPFLDALAADFDVISYDHAGIGESTSRGEQFSTAELAADALALLDALDVPHAHVLGISMGGMVAQELVLTAPDRVRSLVLGCTYAGGAGSSLIAPGPIMMFEAMQTGDADKAVRATFEANFSAAYVADDAHYPPWLTMALAVQVPVPIVIAQAQAAFVHDTSTRLPTVTAPTLVLHGTTDQVIPYLNASLIAAAIPGAKLITFDDVGHLFWLERHDETVAAVRRHCLS
jgi:pimeloyl-ACP methyl ester carboxylesterase